VPRRRLALGLAGCALLALASTCKVYPDSLLDPRPGDTPIADGSTGVGFWSGTGDNGCFSAKSPTEDLRPAATDASDIEPFFLGIDQLWLGGQRLDGTIDKDAWRDFGFDLDDKCTASATCDVEHTDSSCKRVTAGQAPDGNNCRDNNFGKLQNIVSGSSDVGGRLGLNDGTFNCGLCYGRYNILIRISGYNGTANDDDIRIDLYRSPGVETELPLTSCDGDPAARLCWWLAASTWTIDRASTVNHQATSGLPEAEIADPHAFVRDGYLVARFPEKALIWFPGTYQKNTTFPLQLTRGIVTARLARSEDSTWRMTDGVIGGRVTGEDVIWGFRRVGLCESDPLYGVAQSAIKANLDITAAPDAAPDAPCDSISLGVIFAARQATVGKLTDGPQLVECPPVGGAAGAGGSGGSGG